MKLITLIILAALLFLSLYLGISASKLRRAAINRANSWPEVLDLIFHLCNLAHQSLKVWLI